MAGYGQFCPMAKAMEVLDERWTLLVVRELLLGSTHFNELRRGNPRMSPALLSKRLRTLERAGVVRRELVEGRTRYTLTPAGEELRPVIEALQVWGARWVGSLGVEDLDPHLLLWDIQRTMPMERWPSGRTVVAVRFPDVEPRVSSWWMCVSDRTPDVCDVDPGFEVLGWLHVSLRTLSEIWRGDRSWSTAARDGLFSVDGPPELARRLPEWIGQSSAAAVPRPQQAGLVGPAS
ncbi:winged helix-turn-helix transcriptional regulator [Nocardioides sambongensis]|uniref:winged helix-turn-helix transcriptional regulator n=1 Tax=Nocardioides sambongensis TaxID=2589074 RepID=UPI001129E4AF|nr:helix-turn-helix domain-containing protein [Nocardioides sambongensis]